MKSKVAFFLIVFLMAGCKQDPKTGSNAASSTTYTGRALSPAPVTDSREAQLLLKDYWVFEFYVVPGTKEDRIAGKGRWYIFQPDGTFKSGQWENDGASGSWFLTREPNGDMLLLLDSYDDAQDSEFNIKFNATGDESSWVGTKRFKQSDVIVKVINLLTKPTKKQFGLEE